MKMKTAIENAIKNNFPFVLFRKPQKDTIDAYFQNTNEVCLLNSDEPKNGFVFAPFNNSDKGYIIKNSLSEKLEFNIDKKDSHNSNFSIVSNQQDEHTKLVDVAIKHINKSNIKKVVISRKELLELESVDIASLYENLFKQYPNAFVYCWFHPETGIWMGATPERLLKVSNAEFEVMALASTQEYRGSIDVDWGTKEIEEHQIVVDYIKEALNEYEIKLSEAYTVKAGNLLHLRADIKGKVASLNNIQKLIDVIHPTPATCGLPKDAAKQFVLENENYHREFYTGYLGEISEGNADLFVNLRCMKVDLDLKSIAIYVGGGITKDSIPDKEWNETVAKSQVMKKVL